MLNYVFLKHITLDILIPVWNCHNANDDWKWLVVRCQWRVSQMTHHVDNLPWWVWWFSLRTRQTIQLESSYDMWICSRFHSLSPLMVSDQSVRCQFRKETNIYKNPYIWLPFMYSATILDSNITSYTWTNISPC